MSFYSVTRKVFFASLGGFLAACGGGMRFLAGSQGSPNGGSWRSLGHPKELTNCEHIALLKLRLPSQRRKTGFRTGQLAVASQEMAGVTCQVTPRHQPAMPLIIKIPVDHVTFDKGRGNLALTSGSLELQGYPSEIDGPTAGTSGKAAFHASADFSQQLRNGGFTPSRDELLQLGLSHASIRDVREITTAFPDATLDTVSRFRWFGLPANAAVDLKKSISSLSARDLISFAGLGITTEYVKRIRKTLGKEQLTPGRIRAAALADLARARHE